MTKIDGSAPKPGPSSDWYEKMDELDADKEGFIGTHGGGPAQPACPHCLGFGVRTDVKPVEIYCAACYGTGIHNKLND